MDPKILLEQLIDFEQRVRGLYLAYGNRSEFPAEVRFFWNNMAEDEGSHAAVLQRSAGFLDLIESPPHVSEDTLAHIAEKIGQAEAGLKQAQLTSDAAFHQALVIEGSELNSVDEAWFHGFRPALGTLLRAIAPEEEDHISRLVSAIHAFSADKALQDRAADLWAEYLRKSVDRCGV